MQTHSFVALLDVIGYKNKIKQDLNNEQEDFKNKLIKSIGNFSNINQAQFQCQAISDTIIISAHGFNYIIDFFKILSGIHCDFLANGLFVRGGIAYSKHHQSGILTYSHALSAAHDLEQSQAIYPRIVIDKNIIEMIRQSDKLNLAKSEIKEMNLICEENGVYFLNTAFNSKDAVYENAKALYNSDKNYLRERESEFAKHRWFQNFILSLDVSFVHYISEISPATDLF